MRPKGILAALPLAVAVLACDRPRTGSELAEHHTFPASAGKLVRIESRSLDVEVVVAEAPEIAVDVRLEARATSRSQAARWVTRHRPRFDDTPETLTITLPRSGSVAFVGFAATNGSLVVTIPPSCRLEVNGSSGDVVLRGSARMASEARIETSSGDVEISGGARAVVVESTSGDVEITGDRLDLADVRTTSGDVTLRAGCARTLVETASGDVRLAALAGELSVTTASGNVRASFDALTPGDSVRVDTASGDITLLLPNLPLAGKVRTASGHVRSRFDGTWDRPHRELTLAAAEGAVQLSVRSRSGTIVLGKR